MPAGDGESHGPGEDRRRRRSAQPVPTPAPVVPTPFIPNTANARAEALQRYLSILQSRGLNPEEFQPGLQAELSRINVPSGADPTQFYNDAFLETYLGNEQGNRRQLYTNQLNQQFPVGSNPFGDTADDEAIFNILNEAYTRAMQPIESAKSLGNLSGMGYESALSDLNNQKAAALQQLQTLGGGIRSERGQQYRGALDKAYNSASNYQLGQNIDFDSLISEINAVPQGTNYDQLLRNTLGDTQQLFRPYSAISAGGVASGPSNDAGGILRGALQRYDKDRNSTRGTGSQGAF